MLIPFNPRTPDADASMALLPDPTPQGPLPAGAVCLMPTLTLEMHPCFRKELVAA